MKPIPCEARATIHAFRDGCSPEKFIDDMWARRENENPRNAAASKDGWPVKLVGKPSDPPKIAIVPRDPKVTPLKSRGAK